MPLIKHSYQSRSKSHPHIWKHFNLGQKFLVIYLVLMVIFGVPLTIWSVRQTLLYRSDATPQTITVTAAIPQTSLNTGEYKPGDNLPPLIRGEKVLNLTVGTPYDIEYTITDLDWQSGDQPPFISFNPQFEFPQGLSHECITFGNFGICRIYGTPQSWIPSGQTIYINAADIHSESSSLEVTVNFTHP